MIVAQGCEDCEPQVRSFSDTRLNERHFAVHLGDSHLHAYLNGIDTKDCLEVIAGKGGRAIRHAQPFRLCECGSNKILTVLDLDDGYSVGGIVPKALV